MPIDPENGNLVLARNPGQTVELADGLIQIVVERIKGNRATLRIVAPRDIPIRRGESKPRVFSLVNS